MPGAAAEYASCAFAYDDADTMASIIPMLLATDVATVVEPPLINPLPPCTYVSFVY